MIGLKDQSSNGWWAQYSFGVSAIICWLH